MSASTSASASASVSASASTSASAGRWQVPEAGAAFDYQISGAYPPPLGVRVVSRDSSDAPAPGLYSICYVNAFQAQPGARSETWWRTHHPDLLLHDAHGKEVVDHDWNEILLDVSTPAKRSALAQVEAPWLAHCRSAGFQAVEPDNLDSYQRSDKLLTAADNTAFARLLVARAHADGLAAAQKNAAELLGAHGHMGFDFAVTEECGAYGECGEYAEAYQDRVFDVEYTDTGLHDACRAWSARIAIVRRDLDVLTPADPGYVRRTC